MKRAHTIIAASVAIALIAAGVTWWSISRPTPAQRFYEPDDEQARIAREARSVYATLDMTPVAVFADRQAAESYFEQVPIQDPQPATAQIPAALNETERAEAKAKLRTVMAQFVHYRLTTTGDPDRDADRYLAWRHNRGDVVRPIDDRPPYNGDMYEHYIGSPVPPGIALDRAYREVHIASEKQKPDASRIAAISTDPSESLFVTWWAHTHISSDHPIINHPRGHEYWRDGKHGSSSTWFRYVHEDPRSDTRVQVRLYAMGGVIIETESGSRYPIVLGLVWNQQRADWDIRGLSFVNADLANIPALIF